MEIKDVNPGEMEIKLAENQAEIPDDHKEMTITEVKTVTTRMTIAHVKIKIEQNNIKIGAHLRAAEKLEAENANLNNLLLTAQEFVSTK